MLNHPGELDRSLRAHPLLNLDILPRAWVYISLSTLEAEHSFGAGSSFVSLPLEESNVVLKTQPATHGMTMRLAGTATKTDPDVYIVIKTNLLQSSREGVAEQKQNVQKRFHADRTHAKGFHFRCVRGAGMVAERLS